MREHKIENDRSYELSNDFLSLTIAGNSIQNLKVDPFGKKEYKEALMRDILLQEPILLPHSKPLENHTLQKQESSSRLVEEENRIELNNTFMPNLFDGKIEYSLQDNNLECKFTASCIQEFRGWDMGFEAGIPGDEKRIRSHRPFHLLSNEKGVALPLERPIRFSVEKKSGFGGFNPIKEGMLYCDRWIHGFGSEGYDARFASFGYCLRWKIGKQSTQLSFYPKKILEAKKGTIITRKICITFLPPTEDKDRTKLIELERGEVLAQVEEIVDPQYPRSNILKESFNNWINFEGWNTDLGNTLVAGINREVPNRRLVLSNLKNTQYLVKAGLISPKIGGKAIQDPFIYSYEIEGTWKRIPVWNEEAASVVREYPLNTCDITDGRFEMKIGKITNQWCEINAINNRFGGWSYLRLTPITQPKHEITVNQTERYTEIGNGFYRLFLSNDLWASHINRFILWNGYQWIDMLAFTQDIGWGGTEYGFFAPRQYLFSQDLDKLKETEELEVTVIRNVYVRGELNRLATHFTIQRNNPSLKFNSEVLEGRIGGINTVLNTILFFPHGDVGGTNVLETSGYPVDHTYSNPNRVLGYGDAVTPETPGWNNKNRFWKPLSEMTEDFLLFYRDSAPNYDILLTFKDKLGDDHKDSTCKLFMNYEGARETGWFDFNLWRAHGNFKKGYKTSPKWLTIRYNPERLSDDEHYMYAKKTSDVLLK